MVMGRSEAGSTLGNNAQYQDGAVGLEIAAVALGQAAQLRERLQGAILAADGEDVDVPHCRRRLR